MKELRKLDLPATVYIELVEKVDQVLHGGLRHFEPNITLLVIVGSECILPISNAVAIN